MKFKTIFSFWFLWRAGLFLLSAIAITTLPTFGNRFPYVNEMLKSSGLPEWLWQFGNFDGVHYLGIAKDGYIRQFTQAFFPVYPIMLKITSIIFFNNFVLAGIVLSSIFTLLAIWMLCKLINTNKWVILFFLFFPMSFFLGSIYNESFFLFLVFTCFYFGKKRNWLAVGVLGALASGTRLVGMFLLPAILWEMLNADRHGSLSLQQKMKNFLYVLLIPSGLFLYMAYLQIRFHDALYFLHVQGAFGASRSTGIVFPLVTVWRYVKILTTVPISQYNFWVAFWEIGFFIVGGILLTIITIKKMGQTQKHASDTTQQALQTGRSVPTTKRYTPTIDSSYLIFAWLCFLLPTLTGTLSSFPRYLLVCFPIYIFLGNLQSKLVKSILLSIFIILNSIFLILFSRGYWVS